MRIECIDQVYDVQYQRQLSSRPLQATQLNSQKAEPTETRKRPPAEAAEKAPSATVDPAAPEGVLVLEDQRRVPEVERPAGSSGS